MGSIYVNFNLKSAATVIDSNEYLDKNYQSVYKPLIKFLYTHPEFPFSFSFSGSQIQFFKKRKNELLVILKELIDRKQVEIIGGGYYTPVLPLIYPVDRNGQIDLLSSEIRLTTGKRPRGISLFSDCWDSSLVNNINTCGIEYVILDSTILPDNKRTFMPIIMTDLGKSVDIIPYYENLKPTKDVTPANFIESIIKAVDKVQKKENFLQLDLDRVITISFEHNEVSELMEAKWFDQLDNYLLSNIESNIVISTPYNYLKNCQMKLPAYIASGINKKAKSLIEKLQSEDKRSSTFTIHNFMDSCAASHALYDRIMYVSMLVNQYKNDKMRKKAAREKLWEGQSGLGLLFTSNKPFINNSYVRSSYKILMEAEKILRGDGKFKESITCFDYNSDGLEEYVCRMENYFATINLISGSVREFDIVKSNYNYIDNYSRKLEYDGYEDNYKRGLFVDHLFTESQFENYINNEPSGNGVFSRIRYLPLKYSQNHKEILLEANAIWKPSNQKVYLRKKYIINSTGMYVQYIIRNDSNKQLKAKFAVESNFANVNYNPDEVTYYNLEVLDNNDLITIDTANNTKPMIEKGQLFNTQIARLTDSQNGTSFVLEPNEKSGFCYNPLILQRIDFNDNSKAPISMSHVTTFFWDINIEPGMETEKSINLSIVPVKKNKNK